MSILPLTASSICEFIKYLASTATNSQSIMNIISSIKLYMELKGEDVSVFDDITVALMKKAIKLNIPKAVKPRKLLSPQDFAKICGHINIDTHGLNCFALRLGLIMGFLGFLRRGNIAPDSVATFDSSKHTSRQDCHVSDHGFVIRLTWTKTRHNQEPLFITIPHMTLSHINAVYNFNTMIQVSKVSGQPRSPLLLFADGGVITAPFLAKVLSTTAAQVGLDPSGLTLHALRRAGATASQHAGAQGPSIAKQGTWASDTYMHYLLSSENAPSPVQQALEIAFSKVV